MKTNSTGLRGLAMSAAVASLIAAGGAQAKASAEEAAKLGKSLTPIGAEKGGNGGVIPEWTGGLPKAGDAKGYRGSNPEIEAEKPLFTITKANMAEHKDKLTASHQELFKRFPNYKMNVYKTHRTVSFPQEIYDATIKNATTGELVGTDSVKNVRLGFPFPIPSNGAEVIWNHKMKWKGNAVRRYNNQAIVQPDGNYQISKLIEDVDFLYGDIKRPGDPAKPLLFYLSEILAPPRNAGQLILAHETSDQTVEVRKAWIYNPGLRRVRRAPNVAYDNPYEGTDGNQFNDQVDMFNGAMDRYNWKLVGKKEIYLPYNSYKIQSDKVKYDEIIAPNHINQDLARYELHRAWVVDSTLREGTSHSFGRRTFYVDEDSWNIAVIDCYDKRGGLWKVQEGHMGTAQNVQTAGGSPEIIYDLQSGRYFLTALANEDKPNDFSVKYNSKYFTTKALKKKTTR